MVHQVNRAENFTEDEATLYDRQIRLWGLEAQKRLRKTRLLIIGMQGLSGETVKNIVLAGIEAVVLCDSENATADDVHANFLIPISCIGKNRAVSSVERTQILNPTVKVSADTRPVNEIDENFIKNFSVVLATNCELSDLNRLNEYCRNNNIKFYCGQIWGSVGYYFVDLNEHYYVKEEKMITSKKDNEKNRKRDHTGALVAANTSNAIDLDSDEDDTATNSVNHKSDENEVHMIVDDEDDEDGKCVDNDTKNNDKIEENDTNGNANDNREPKVQEEIRYVERSEIFPTLKEALNVDLTDAYYQKKIKRKKFDPTFFAVLVLIRFRTVFGRNPQRESLTKDFTALMKIREEIMKVMKVDINYLPKKYLCHVFEEFSPVCAVMGGVLAQEIILAISGTETPHKNFFLFNPIETAGRVHYIGPPKYRPLEV